MSTSLRVHEAPPTTPLSLLVEDYLDSCHARGLSKNTIDQAYAFSLRDVFLPWCAGQGVRDVDELTQRVLDRFTAHLIQTGGLRGPLSPSTVHSYVRPVRQLLTWAAKEGERTTGARPQLPRQPRVILDVLSREEIDRLEDAAISDRDRLIIRLLADTGMRVSELCQLRPSDITRHHGGSLLRVNGKGDKQRFVPLTPRITRRLDQFVRRRPADAPETIFYGLRRDRDGLFHPLKRNGLLQMIGVVADRAKLGKRVYPHLLRHSFATRRSAEGSVRSSWRTSSATAGCG